MRFGLRRDMAMIPAKALACLALSLLLLWLPRALAADGPEGRWIGYWEREGSRLPVEMTFTRTDTGYDGHFSSVQLRVSKIPFSNVRSAAERLSWDIRGDSGTSHFDGRLSADTLRGDYSEGDAKGAFSFRRADGREAALTERDIEFKSGDVALSGTMVLPPGEGPFPGVVFLHGSRAEGRWATRYLADAFAQRGIAALSYDKRGVGRSKGDWREAGFADLVGDASAAIEAMRVQVGIDAARVGIHGHSQGGTLAPWVAVRNGHVAFVIASAAGALPGADIEHYSIGNSIGLRDLAPKEQQLAERFVDAIVATAYEGAPRDELDAIWMQVRDRPWAFEPPPPSDPYWSFSRRVASYDATRYWRELTMPALALYGELDERVEPRPNARIAQAYLGAKGSRLEVMIFPGADHGFRIRPQKPGFAWPQTVSGYPDEMIDWSLAALKNEM